MQELIYGSYILFWPILTLVMLGVIVGAVLRDYRTAKRNGTEMV